VTFTPTRIGVAVAATASEGANFITVPDKLTHDGQLPFSEIFSGSVSTTPAAAFADTLKSKVAALPPATTETGAVKSGGTAGTATSTRPAFVKIATRFSVGVTSTNVFARSVEITCAAKPAGGNPINS
jgi:hypothetical protein